MNKPKPLSGSICKIPKQIFLYTNASKHFNATKLLAKHAGATPIDLDACNQILPVQAKGLSKAGGCQC